MSRLPNAPLQEVIFELRWELQPDSISQSAIDPDFDFVVGQFKVLAETELGLGYSHRKFPQIIHSSLTPYTAIYQYRKSEDSWPIVQLGPGVFTVNTTDEFYFWEEFLEFISAALIQLSSAYDRALNINFASLKYIDYVSVGQIEPGKWEDEIRKRFKLDVINGEFLEGPLKAFQFNQVFDLDQMSELHLSIGSARHNESREDLIMWQTSVVRQSEMSLKEISSWAVFAHDVASRTFKNMLTDEFYNSFK